MLKPMYKLRSLCTLYLVASFIIILIFGGLVHNLVQKSSVKSALEISLRAIAQKQEKITEPRLMPYLGEVSHYVNWVSTPVNLRSRFNPKQLETNAISVDFNDKNKVVAVLSYLGANKRVTYYLLEVDKSALPEPIQGINEGILLYILATLLLMFFIAYLLAKNIMQPLKLLAEFAKKNEMSAIEIPGTLTERKDEIGDVAKALNLSLHNIRAQQDREKQFLQNASHELRSPLATIGSALHVINLRQTKGLGFDDKLLQIKRCYHQMTQLTQALLWLSKEEKSVKTCEFNLSELIELHLHQLDHLISNKAIEVVFIRDNVLVDQARALVDVVISNLIRNAFENSAGGKIILHHSSNGVSISNPIYNQKQRAEHAQQHQGFGLGLHLVNKVIKKQNWTLNIHESEQQMNVQVSW